MGAGTLGLSDLKFFSGTCSSLQDVFFALGLGLQNPRLVLTVIGKGSNDSLLECFES